MGKLVTFWSPYIGQAKVTATLCAVAGSFGMLYPEMDVALCQAVPGKLELESKLDSRDSIEERSNLYAKLGISALSLNYMQEMLTSEKIRRCALPLLMRSLYLYPHLEKENADKELTFHLLSNCLVKEFDLLFLDLKSGYDKTSLRYMEAADLVVVVLPQAPIYWSDFFNDLEEHFTGKNLVVILGASLGKSRYSIQYYERKKLYMEKIVLAGAVPLNVGYMDALAEGNTLHFLLRNQFVRKKEENYEFIFQAKKTAETIRKILFLS